MMRDGSDRNPETGHLRRHLHDAEDGAKPVDNQSFSNGMNRKRYQKEGFHIASSSEYVYRCRNPPQDVDERSSCDNRSKCCEKAKC